MGCVYCAMNKTNGKYYVGMSSDSMWSRIYGHSSSAFNGSSKTAFSNALRKYGMARFSWREIFYSDDTDELFEAERRLIIEYNSRVPYGYNMTDGGEGYVGGKHTKEWKQKISKSQTGRVMSKETRKKISIGRKRMLEDNPMSVESKRKMSESHKGKKASLETRMKMSKAGKKRFGWHHSLESRRKMSQSHKGKITSLETRRKMSESRRGVPREPITKLKIKLALSGRRTRPIGYIHNQETKDKIRESVKSWWEERKRNEVSK